MFTVPETVCLETVNEILDENGFETGRLHVEWRKVNGGDEIDVFMVLCVYGSVSVTEEVPFVSGQSYYEHNTTNLVQGGTVYITIYAINSVGNSTHNPYAFNTGILFYCLITECIFIFFRFVLNCNCCNLFLAPPVPSNVKITKPVSGNTTINFVVNWNMPDFDLYYASMYKITYFQLRNDVFIRPVFVEAPNLEATLSATCPGEIVSAKVQAISGLIAGQNSVESPWYQTGNEYLNIQLFDY